VANWTCRLLHVPLSPLLFSFALSAPTCGGERSLETQCPRSRDLTERLRNAFGPAWRFTFQRDVDHTYASSLPLVWPDIAHSHVECQPIP
jgi:hypothetical protein